MAENIEKEIDGIKYTFKNKPMAKDIIAIANENTAKGDMNVLYRELAKFLIISPTMTDEKWNELTSIAYYEIINTIYDLTGLDRLLFRLFKPR